MSTAISIGIFICAFVLPFCILAGWVKSSTRRKLPPDDVPPPPKTKKDKENDNSTDSTR